MSDKPAIFISGIEERQFGVPAEFCWCLDAFVDSEFDIIIGCDTWFDTDVINYLIHRHEYFDHIDVYVSELYNGEELPSIRYHRVSRSKYSMFMSNGELANIEMANICTHALTVFDGYENPFDYGPHHGFKSAVRVNALEKPATAVFSCSLRQMYTERGFRFVGRQLPPCKNTFKELRSAHVPNISIINNRNKEGYLTSNDIAEGKIWHGSHYGNGSLHLE